MCRNLQTHKQLQRSVFGRVFASLVSDQGEENISSGEDMEEKPTNEQVSVEEPPPHRGQKITTVLLCLGLCGVLTYAFLQHRAAKQSAARGNELSAALSQERSVEVVINGIGKDAARGYVSEPKYMPSELAASTATPGGVQSTSASKTAPGSSPEAATLKRRPETQE